MRGGGSIHFGGILAFCCNPMAAILETAKGTTTHQKGNVMGGRGARRRADQAAQAAQQEAAQAKVVQAETEDRRKREEQRAQRLVLRRLQARGGLFFEDATPKGTLGGSGRVL